MSGGSPRSLAVLGQGVGVQSDSAGSLIHEVEILQSYLLLQVVVLSGEDSVW